MYSHLLSPIHVIEQRNTDVYNLIFNVHVHVWTLFFEYREEAGDTQLPIVPPNTRAPSPDRALSYSEAVPPERDRLPYAEPIPPEHAALAEPWIKVNGWFI